MTCISERFINESILSDEILLENLDELINSDPELNKLISEMSNSLLLEGEYLEEGVVGTIALAIFIVNLAIVLIQVCITFFVVGTKRIADPKLTSVVRDIVHDNELTCYKIPDPTPNAFNIGTSSLYYYTGIHKLVGDKELIAIMLHEYGHYVGGHVWEKLAGLTVAIGLLAGTMALVLSGLPVIAGSIAIVIVQILFGPVVMAIMNKLIGRPQEYFADSYAAKHGYGRELITALKKLDSYIRGELCKGLTKQDCDDIIKDRHRWDEHPELEDRIRNILDNSLVKRVIATRNMTLITAFFEKIKMKFVGMLGESFMYNPVNECGCGSFSTSKELFKVIRMIENQSNKHE